MMKRVRIGDPAIYIYLQKLKKKKKCNVKRKYAEKMLKEKIITQKQNTYI